jgi:hypothetical protein
MELSHFGAKVCIRQQSNLFYEKTYLFLSKKYFFEPEVNF